MGRYKTYPYKYILGEPIPTETPAQIVSLRNPDSVPTYQQ